MTLVTHFSRLGFFSLSAVVLASVFSSPTQLNRNFFLVFYNFVSFLFDLHSHLIVLGHELSRVKPDKLNKKTKEKKKLNSKPILAMFTKLQLNYNPIHLLHYFQLAEIAQYYLSLLRLQDRFWDMLLVNSSWNDSKINVHYLRTC